MPEAERKQVTKNGVLVGGGVTGTAILIVDKLVLPILEKPNGELIIGGLLALVIVGYYADRIINRSKV
ncbi:MAG: hypothetical protein Q7Q73_06180 [Verrucomicrobiota bacterium JB024]|nr:hypothetical protein [Verrucomicrobiota bacterium JB024]